MSLIKTAFIAYTVVFATTISAQQYDFAAEITRQCLVPDPVGLLDCVENKVTLPYLTSWVECTNSLGENVATSADIINYRCKSVWEGKSVIPEVFYIKDCVIERTGLPAPNVSAEVLGAYKECESSPQNPQKVQQVKTAPAAVNSLSIQQQKVQVSPPFTQSQVQYVQQQKVEVSPPFTQPQVQYVPPPSQQYSKPITSNLPVQQQQVALPVSAKSPTVFAPLTSANPPAVFPPPSSQQYFTLYPMAARPIYQQASKQLAQQQNPQYIQQAPLSQPIFAQSQTYQQPKAQQVYQQQQPTYQQQSYKQQTFQQPYQYQQKTNQQQVQPQFVPQQTGPYYYSIKSTHPSRKY